MRSFWGYYDNGTYRVGCNSGTIYVYDQNNKELAKFKDIKYAYKGKFLPSKNIFVIKSTEGSLAVYDLAQLKLIKKIVVTRLGAQDEGFAFSPDGEYFYNIEKPFSSIKTRLSKYRTSDFTLVETLFADRTDIVLTDIEFDSDTKDCYLLGFTRKENGVFDYGFIGQLVQNHISNMKKLDHAAYDYIQAYKNWEASGFTDKALEYSHTLQSRTQIEPITLKDICQNRVLRFLPQKPK